MLVIEISDSTTKIQFINGKDKNNDNFIYNFV